MRYEDDERSYINVDYGDEKGLLELWENATPLPGREANRRLKLKVAEFNSPCTLSQLSDKNDFVQRSERPYASKRLKIEEFLTAPS